jgi:hypothetical protein
MSNNVIRNLKIMIERKTIEQVKELDIKEREFQLKRNDMEYMLQMCNRINGIIEKNLSGEMTTETKN